MFQDLHVIDLHAHFPIRGDVAMGGGNRTRQTGRIDDPTAAGRQAFRQRQLEQTRHQWRMAFDFPDPETEPRSSEEQADRWLAELDRYGLERIGFVTGRDNDELSRVVAMHPDRFFGFAHHDITAPGAAAELERAVTQLGLKGLKLFGPLTNVIMHDPSLYPVWEVCERLGIPVLIHFGMQGAAGGISYHMNMSPAVLEPVARDFPTVDFIIPHFGIQHVTDLLFLCWSCPNVNVDSSGSNQWVRWMPYKLTLEDLFQRFFETIGPERILFGSDSSWFPRGFAVRYLQDQLRICRFMGMTHDQLQLVFGGNAARIMKVPLTAGLAGAAVPPVDADAAPKETGDT